MKLAFEISSASFGQGPVLTAWGCKGVLLAVAQAKRQVLLLGHDGQEQHSFNLDIPNVKSTMNKNGPAARALVWCPQGAALAVLPAASDFLFVWESSSKRATKVALGPHIPQQEMVAADWSADSARLTIGTSKGTILVLDMTTRRVMHNFPGIHEQAVTCVVISGDIICTTGEDSKLNLMTTSGSAISSVTIDAPALEARFAPVNNPKASAPAAQLSVTDGSSVYMFNTKLMQQGDTKQGMVQLAFNNAELGPVLHHCWLGAGIILVAFKSGCLKLVSTLESSMGAQHATLQLPGPCSAVAACREVSRVAVASASKVRIVNVSSDLTDLPSEALKLAESNVQQLCWSSGGQLLSIASATGHLYCALGSLPAVAAASGDSYTYLSSLSQATMFTALSGSQTTVELKFTPHFMALSGTHLAAGMNNRVMIHKINGGKKDAPELRMYDEGSVEALHMNSSLVAALVGGRVLVHGIEDTRAEPQVPYRGQDVSAFAMTEDFVIIGTSGGLLQHYSVKQGPLAPLNEYMYEARGGKRAGITGVWAAPGSTHLVFADDTNKLHMFSCVDDQVVSIPEVTGIVKTVLFDSLDPNVFLVAEQRSWTVLVYAPVTVRGPRVRRLHATEADPSARPLVLASGCVYSQTDTGQIVTQGIPALSGAGDAAASDSENLQRALAANDIGAALAVATRLQQPEAFAEVGAAALELLELPSAIAALREAGNASHVLALDALRNVEDRHMLAGYILALTEQDYDTAEGMFLRAGRQDVALQMRQDLRQWGAALKLAERCAPEQAMHIKQHHAEALEIQGDVGAALQYFQEALAEAPPADVDLVRACKAGAARCTIHAGDVRGGVALALRSGSKAVMRDCAAILCGGRGAGTSMEAAELYEAAGDAEQAVAVYLDAKALARVEPLMKHVTTPKLILAYAKAMEEDGRFLQAAAEYERGGDDEAAVRLCLSQLDNVNRAFALARRSGSIAAAALVARHCSAASMWAGAVEFSVRARDFGGAWQIAQTHREMDAYAAALDADAPAEMRAQVAVFFQNVKEHRKAAAQFEAAGNMLSAVSQLMAHAKRVDGSERDEVMRHALEIVAAAPQDEARRMAHMVMSSVDQHDHDRFAEQFVELNLALGNRDAALAAIVNAALAEQARGSYKVAHKRLLDACLRFRDGRVAPTQLQAALAVLHSYVLVKAQAKLGHQETAARLLKRTAAALTRFQAHAPQILASAAIQCSHAGLHESAFALAGELMQPQHRDAMNAMAAHKRKLESLVRKPSRTKDPEDVLVPCCWCRTPGPEFDLQCGSCQSMVPFCMASGKRMLSTEWLECPSCRFPARRSEISSYLESLQKCPMCSLKMEEADCIVVSDPGKLRQDTVVEASENRASLLNG